MSPEFTKVVFRMCVPTSSKPQTEFDQICNEHMFGANLYARDYFEHFLK